MKQIHAAVFGLGTFFAMNCGSGTESGYPEPSPAGSTGQQEQRPGGPSTTEALALAEVTVNGHSFDPPEVRIKAGGTVRWTWAAGSHNVVSGTRCTTDGKFSSGDVQGAGTQFEQKLDAPGTYPYFCDPHCSMGMTGKVIVE